MFLKGIILICLPAGLLFSGEPTLFAPNHAEPGRMVQMVVTGGDLDQVSVSLQNEGGQALSRAEGFEWRSPRGKTVTVVLMGLPSTLDVGRYRLVANGRQGSAEWHFHRFLDVTEKEYPEEVIALTTRMNTLYTEESARKKAEARALWAVLLTFNEDAVYHPGPLLSPLDGVVTGEFGTRRRYRMTDGTESASVHFGQDLWAERGTAILAAARGRIAMATERYLTGKTVIIEHLPGVYTLYYHMDSIDVQEGEMVGQGDRIGTVGDTGFVTKEHLHWELRVGAAAVNPHLVLTAPLLDTGALIDMME